MKLVMKMMTMCSMTYIINVVVSKIAVKRGTVKNVLMTIILQVKRTAKTCGKIITIKTIIIMTYILWLRAWTGVHKSCEYQNTNV